MKKTISSLLAAGLAVAAIAGCGGGASSAAPAANGSAPAAGEQAVLPVARSPIAKTGTASGLTITKALVENNVAASTGKAVDDHLEVALKNTSAKPLSGIGIYYKVTDPSKGASEGYYTKLGPGFAIKPGETRVAHFDGAGAKDHFPVNRYGLYYTDKNALVVDVTAGAQGMKPATFQVKKDSGGAEAGVE